MAETFPKWEDTLPVNEAPRFEDTQPVVEAPSFEQTKEPTVKDEIRAAIPEIVQQIRQAIIPAPQMAEFTPQQIQQTNPEATVDVRAMEPPPTNVDGVQLAGNLQPGSVETMPKLEAPEAAAQLRAAQSFIYNPEDPLGLKGMRELGAAAYSKGMGEQVAPEQEKALQDFTVENFKGIVLYPAAIASVANAVGWYVANRTLPGSVAAAREAVTKGLVRNGVPAEQASRMADEGMTQAVAKAQAAGSEVGIPEFVKIRKAAERGFGPKGETPNVPAVSPEPAPQAQRPTPEATPMASPKPLTGSPERDAILSEQIETAKAGLAERPTAPLEGWKSEPVAGGGTSLESPGGYRVFVPEGQDPARAAAAIREIERAEYGKSEIPEPKFEETAPMPEVPYAKETGAKVEGAGQEVKPPEGPGPGVYLRNAEENRVGTKKRKIKQPWEMTREEFSRKFATHGTSSEIAEKIKSEGLTSGFASSPVPWVKNKEGKVVPMAIAHQFGDKILGFKVSDIDSKDQWTLKEGAKPVWEVNAGEPEHYQLVKLAISEGKDIPLEVLKDYPELTPKYSSGEPAKTMPKAPADAISEAIKSIGFPEDAQVSKNLRLYNLVEMFRGMEGGVPQVVRKFTDPRVLGKASAKGRIRLRAALGQNEDMASLVLAHEMAHVVDAAYGDTTHTYARGNILGRLGAMDRYLYDNLSRSIKPREEMVRRIKEIKAGVLGQARSLADEAKLKGPARADFIKAKVKELSQPALAAEGYVSKETITKELTDLAKWWNKDPNFKGKGVELYAEGMSTFMLTPKDVAKRAPHFNEVIKNWIQKKPEFEQAINEFWANLEKGPAEGAGRVYNRAIDNFQKHRDTKVAAEEKTIAAKESLGALDLAVMALDYTIPLTNKMSQMGLHPWDNPYHEIQAWTHSAAPKEAYLRRVNDNVRKAVLDSKRLTEDMVGVQLLLNRVALGDRSDLLNTLGITEKSAPEIEAVLKERAGDEYEKLQQIVEGVYDAHREILADGKGVLNEAGLKKMLDNRYYATFSLTKFIEDMRGGGGEVGKLIHPQIGSLDDVGSPLEALIEKDVRLQYTFLRSKAFQAFYEWGTKLDDGTVLPAERTAGGNFKEAPAGYELVHWLWDSKIQGMYAKDGFWQIFKKQPTEAARYASVGEAALKFFKYAFVNLNPAFFATNVIRDSFFTSANLAELPFFSTKQKYMFGPLESLVRSMREVPAALRHQLGRETSQAVQELKTLGITQSEYNRDMARLTKGLERMIAANGIFTQGRKVDSPGQALLRAMEIALDVGRASDMASKVAALKLLKEKHPDASPAWLAHMIRTRAGTPDTTNKGALTSAYNWIFMYSQVALMGWRGNIAAARENPGGFATKMVGQVILPRLLLMAAGAGLIGHDEDSRKRVKKVVAGIPEWFRASSLVVPLGLTENGKSVFITLPQDELSRTVGGMAYYMVKNMGEAEQKTLLSDILESLKPALDFSFSQAPGLNPLIQTAMQGKDIMDLPQGEGPKDSFGRPMIPARRINEWPVRKGPALASYSKNWWNFAGLGTFTGKMSDKPEEVTSVLEDFFKIPLGGAMLNRFVRVYDAGATTQAFEAKAEAQAEGAVRTNDRIDRMLELHNEFVRSKGTTPTIPDVRQFFLNMREEMPENMRGVSFPEFRRSYNSYIVVTKGRAGEIQSLFKSGSNESKAAALRQLRKELPPADFNAIVSQARRDGMISGRAISLSRE